MFKAVSTLARRRLACDTPPPPPDATDRSAIERLVQTRPSETADRLNAVDGRWVEIVEGLRLDRRMAPVNLVGERQAFLEAWRRGRTRKLQFDFEPATSLGPGPLEDFRRSLARDPFGVEAKYARLADEAIALVEFLSDRSPSRLAEATTLAYGAPDARLVATAKEMLAEPPPPSEPPPTIDAHAAAASLRAGLESGGIESWRVAVDPLMNARMSVDSLRREVKVRADAMFEPRAIERLLVHEIGVHVRRAEHGSRQPLRLLGRGLPGYLATEEGLAVWSEQQAGLLDAGTLRIYAARVVAAEAAMSEGFVEVFRSIEASVGDEAAFEIAARAKRGLLDPSRPGGHTKDHVYLRGWLEVSGHLAAHPHDLRSLRSAKIGLSDLAWFESLCAAGLAVVVADTDDADRRRRG